MNITQSDSDSLDCSESEVKFYISLGANVLLGLVTLVSEFLPYSKCKPNGVIQTTEHILKQITKRDISNEEELNEV